MSPQVGTRKTMQQTVLRFQVVYVTLCVCIANVLSLSYCRN